MQQVCSSVQRWCQRKQSDIAGRFGQLPNCEFAFDFLVRILLPFISASTFLLRFRAIQESALIAKYGAQGFGKVTGCD